MSSQSRVRRKRASKACGRCRVQKSKCSGSYPCLECVKKNTRCDFDHDSQMVTVSRAYLAQLNAQITTLERHGNTRERNSHTAHLQPENTQRLSARVHGSRDCSPEKARESISEYERHPDRFEAFVSSIEPTSSPEPPAALVNPLASGNSRYFADTTGRPIHLGTCSNWSFGRRVLVMMHESVMQAPLPLDSLNFDGTSYDMGWKLDQPDTHGSLSLPTAEYSLYLISAVKFHCGQLFHLYDEKDFMYHFYLHHEDPSGVSSLWYVHYLFILSFGKALVANDNKTHTPPGTDLFLYAMKRLHEFVVFDTSCNPIELAEVLCCASLYLHCVDFRSASYRIIGQAIRVALGGGMHTKIHCHDMDSTRSERCRRVWWTIYILDRQMSSLMGVPMGIPEEQIEAGLPTFPGQSQKSMGLEIQIKLSKVLAQILNTVYGVEGRLDKCFLATMKDALRNIASVTDQLNDSFGIARLGLEGGVCRLSSSLHVLHHQCIVIATRPLLYTFLQARLGQSDLSVAHVHCSGSIRSLILMCIESAQQILTILANLQRENLLESFLRLDLDAIFAASVALVVATAIDAALVKDQQFWSKSCHSLLGHMIHRGNMLAVQFKAEIKILEDMCSRLRAGWGAQDRCQSPSSEIGTKICNDDSEFLVLGTSALDSLDVGERSPKDVEEDGEFDMAEFIWQEGYTTEQLLTFANSIDLNYLDSL